MKVQILYKSLHLHGWSSVEGSTYLEAITALDNEFKDIMLRNPHINMYQITDFRINLIREDQTP